MVKNESKIIERCLQSALPIIDGICVLDTGSTDNTKEIIEDFIKKNNLPGKINEEKFVDFGYSRSKSFVFAKQFLEKTLKWDPKETYGLLLDADHVLRFHSTFDKNSMLGTYEHYKISQTDSTSYYNIRLIRMFENWICLGKTHEFWTVRDNIYHVGAIIENKEMIWIDDKSDGGCKADKYERDVKLLLQGIEEATGDDSFLLKVRYYFYLGQTYFSLKEYKKSIEYYSKRIDAGGWPEETWVSMCNVLKCYVKMNKESNSYLPEIESWALRSYEFRNSRSESLYIVADELIRIKEFSKAQKYIDMGKDIPKPDKELLFLDEELYNHGFTFLQYKLKQERGDKDVFLEAIHLFDKLDPKFYSTSLMNIITLTNVIKLNFIPGFYLREIPKTLSISYEKEKNNYRMIIDNDLILLDKDFKQLQLSKKLETQLTGINISGNYYVSKDGEYGKFVNDSNFQKLGNLEGGVLIHEHCILQSMFPWKIDGNVKNKHVIFNYFKANLPAILYKDNSYILLLTANLELENAKLTILVLVQCNDKGDLQTISNPFCLEKAQSSAVCSFTMDDKNNATIIYFTTINNDFVPCLAQFSLDHLNFLPL